MKTGWASNRTDPDEDYVRRARSLLYKHHPGTAYHSGGIWRAMMVLRLGRWAQSDVVNLSPRDEGFNSAEAQSEGCKRIARTAYDFFHCALAAASWDCGPGGRRTARGG